MRTRTVIRLPLVASFVLLTGVAMAAGGAHPDGDGVGRFQGYDPGSNVVRIGDSEVSITPAAAKSLQEQLEGIRGRPGVGGQGEWVAKFVVVGGIIQNIGLVRADP